MTCPAVQACGLESAEPRLYRMWQRSLPAAVFRAAVFRAAVFRAAVFRAAVFRAAVFRAAVFLSGVAGISGCDDADVTPSVCPVLPSECPAVVPSYANEVAPIIAAHCGQCHTREDPTGPWPFDNPIDVVDWAASIQLDLRECLMPPPETDAPLGAADRETLHTWLMCGAPLE